LNQLPGRRCSGRGSRAGTTRRHPTARWIGRVAAVIWGIATLLLGRASHAQTPVSSTIVLAFDPRSEAQRQAVAAIQAHVQGLPLELVVESVERQHSLELRLAASGALAASRHALGTFYIDVADDRSLLIFFTEAEGEATLIRRLPPNPQGQRVALEQAAIVVRSLVEALLDGGGVGIGPPTGRPQASERDQVRSGQGDQPLPITPEGANPSSLNRPTEVPDHPPAEVGGANRRLAIAAGSAVAPFASDVPWQTGFSAAAQWLAIPVIYVGARYTRFPALTLRSADVVFSVQRRPLELIAGYRERGRLALNAEAG
jgi:hypothetical protein